VRSRTEGAALEAVRGGDDGAAQLGVRPDRGVDDEERPSRGPRHRLVWRLTGPAAERGQVMVSASGRSATSSAMNLTSTSLAFQA